MCTPTSKSPRVLFTSLETKLRFVLMQRVDETIRRPQRFGRGHAISGEDQFLGVEMAVMSPAPGLRSWRTTCPTASVGHGQPFANERGTDVPTVDKQRSTKTPEVASIRPFGARPARTCHALKFYRCRVPHQLAQTRRCTFPDLTFRSAGRPPCLGRVKPDETHIGSNATNANCISIDDPHIAGTQGSILRRGSTRGWCYRRQKAGRHPAGSQVRSNLGPLPFALKPFDACPFVQNAHDGIRDRGASPLVDPCSCHIDVGGTCRLRSRCRQRAVCRGS